MHPFFKLQTLALVVMLATSTACGGLIAPTESTDGDASVPASTDVYAVLRILPAQDECLDPRSGPSLFKPGCRVLVLHMDRACNPDFGETPASAVDVAGVSAKMDDSVRAPQALCRLREVAAPCVGESSIGWCHTTGSCVPLDAGTCGSSICVGASFFNGAVYEDDMATNTLPFLVCPTPWP